jgi:aminoglycoside 6'-N-acetyltransferase
MEESFEEGPFCIRKLAEADLILLSRWLSDPRVAEGYGGRDRPSNVESLRQHYLKGAGRPEYQGIVELEGEPVGYVQFGLLPVATTRKMGYPPDTKVFGIDLFLGDAERWGKGIGSRVVRICAQRVLAGEPTARIILDPRISNERAIRAYEAAGFRKLRVLPRWELHEGVWEDTWLMEYVG